MRISGAVFFLTFLPALLLFARGEDTARKQAWLLPVYSAPVFPRDAAMVLSGELYYALAGIERIMVSRLDSFTPQSDYDELLSRFENDRKIAALLGERSNLFSLSGGYFFLPSVTRVENSRTEKTNVSTNSQGTGITTIQPIFKVSYRFVLLITDETGLVLDRLDRDISAESDWSISDAYSRSRGDCTRDLELWVRGSDAFRFRVIYLSMTNSTVYLPLGANVGIEPGYEFALLGLDSMENRRIYGYARVREVGPEGSRAFVYLDYGLLSTGTAWEEPMKNQRITLFSGIQPWTLTQRVLDVEVRFTNQTVNLLYTGPEALFAPVAGLGLTAELGYDVSLLLRGALIPAGLFGFTLEAGFGQALHVPAFTFGYEFLFGILSMGFGLGETDALTNAAIKDGGVYTHYNGPVSVSMSRLDISFHPALYAEACLGSRVRFRLSGGCSFSFPVSQNISLNGPAGGTNVSVSMPITDPRVSISGQSGQLTGIPFSSFGPFAFADLALRF